MLRRLVRRALWWGGVVTERLYGRRSGRARGARKRALMEWAVPALRLAGGPEPLATWLDALPLPEGGAHRRLTVEIGFGRGERLLQTARQAPAAAFLGSEIWPPGELALVSAIAQGLPPTRAALEGVAARQPNLRLAGSDGLSLLRGLPDGAVDCIELIHPDPWPKRRHWKRRFLSGVALAELARTLVEGGVFRFCSDHADLVGWMLWRMRSAPAFEWLVQGAEDFQSPEWAADWSSRYREKSRTRPVFLAWRKTGTNDWRTKPSGPTG